jgi:hypothetical protein
VRNQRQLPLPARRRRRRYHRRRWRRRRRQQQRPQAPPSSPHSARGCDHRWSRAPGGSRPPRGAVARARAARGAGRWAGAARTGVVRGLPDWRRSYDGRSCGLGSDGRERGRVLAQTFMYPVRLCTPVPRDILAETKFLRTRTTYVTFVVARHSPPSVLAVSRYPHASSRACNRARVLASWRAPRGGLAIGRGGSSFACRLKLERQSRE